MRDMSSPSVLTFTCEPSYHAETFAVPSAVGVLTPVVFSLRVNYIQV